jgi:diguanylate cyclase (GGDEF)-like protein
METHIVLVVGSILLFGGCMGLLIVRLSNPFFKGVGWLGGAFAGGALGASVIALHPDGSGGISELVADTLILLAYVCLHVCIVELTNSRSAVPRLGISLLILQATAYPIFRYLHDTRKLSLVVLGILLAVQSLQNAGLLKKTIRDRMGAPVWFTIVLLVGFAAFNLFRSGVIVVVGVPNSPDLPNPLEVTSAVVFLGTGLGLGFGIFWMASAQLRIALEGLADSDPLTGIYNRRSFVSLCEKELLRSIRTGEQFSLLMFDVDHFKQINDRHGHSVGDAVLCAVVEKLRNSVRNIDSVGRWGGEEFVALLPKADSHSALLVAQRLRFSVESISHATKRPSFELDLLPIAKVKEIDSEETIHVTISIGLATCTGQVDTISDLLHQCDRAMYQAKADGRNRIVSTVAAPKYALLRQE